MSALDLDPPELPDVDVRAPTEPAPGDDSGLRTFGVDDGSHNFSTIKHLNKSGLHYLTACNATHEPTRAMLIGTAVHRMILGVRPGAKAVCCFPGERRQGAKWDSFKAANHDAEILTVPEWEQAEEIAAAVRAHPVAQARLAGARTEVPLKWEEGGIRFSTSGVDLIAADGEDLSDLKTTASVEPEALVRQAMKMLYHCQLSFYRRGARANGYPISRGLFLDCVETAPPYDFVSLELSEDLIDLAEKTVSLWIEKLRAFKSARQWPGYAQAPVVWSVPPWMRDDDDGDGES